MTHRNVDVVILFEKAVRELDVACVLKHVLRYRHGLSAEIIHQNRPDQRALRDLRPDVVVLPFCYQERSNNAFLVCWRDSTFFNMTWEQLLYPGNTRAKTPRGEFAVRHVIHNAWSLAHVDHLASQGVPVENVFVSGNPAFTLYDEPYRNYFRNRAELAGLHNLDPRRRWIFFPENYNWAFYERSMLEQMVSDGQSVQQVDAMRRAVTRSFEEAMRWCADVAVAQDVELIIRPRPATPVEVFIDRVRDVIGNIPPRMRVIEDETVRDWTLASDVVVSSYSTSLIEASVAGKPSYIIEPMPWPEALRQEWHALVPRIRSRAEFRAIASGIGPAATSERLAEWARTSLMSNGDSIVRIADQLARIRRREVPLPSPAPWRSVTLPSSRRLPPRVAFELRRRLLPWMIGRRNSVDAELRHDVAASREIPQRVERWAGILDPYLRSIDHSDPRSHDEER